MQTTVQPFSVTRIAHIEARQQAHAWLVEDLWGDQAVGFIGGTPKTGKTWLALELAVAVASGQPCLGHYPVRQRGHVLLYAAEDTAAAIKQRVTEIARARGIPDLERLAVGLITEVDLRLDDPAHQRRLELTLAGIKPRLLLLDPLVRLHHGDENSAAEVSQLLGFLRRVQRDHQLAIVLVHHIRKSSSAQPGQALRGSSDLHAWSDSNLYLLRRKGRIELHAEHRSHPTPRPMHLDLHNAPSMHLRLLGEVPHDDADADSPADDLAPRILAALTDQPMTRATLRQHLAVRNERLGQTLADLEARGRLRRHDGLLVPVPTP